MKQTPLRVDKGMIQREHDVLFILRVRLLRLLLFVWNVKPKHVRNVVKVIT